MYFNGTDIWGGETMSMQKAIQLLLGLIDIFRLVDTENGALNLYLMEDYRRCNKKNPQFWLESV